ncbi:MAG TPA: hypothetical protein VFR00_07870 [Hyphomicrobiaceae bacterium]|jgi:hypothetical protein|nr:hypothetical protein [Hyphomicrobiaceae bacterium]
MSVDEESKLVALRRARERLEVALAADESWQTLQRLGAATPGRDQEAGSLELRLQSSPIYRAWKNLNAAIEARQRDGAGSAGAAPAAQEIPGHAPERTLPGGETTAPGRPDATARPASVAPAPGAASTSGGAPNVPSRVLPAEAEASVSFVARTPTPARWQPSATASSTQRWVGVDGQGGWSALPESQALRDEEAEVSVVSVDALNHAGAVQRLLRALRGETNQG